jgi:hypothetical protein
MTARQGAESTALLDMPCPLVLRQRRWRAKKRKAEIAAGLRPRRRKRKSAAEIKRAYRSKLKRKVEEAKYVWQVASAELALGLYRRSSRSFAPVTAGKHFMTLLQRASRLCLRIRRGEMIRSRSIAGSPTLPRAYLCRVDPWSATLESPPGIATPASSRSDYSRGRCSTCRTPRSPMLGEFVRIGGKPVFWFSKGPRRNQLIVPTLARSSGKDKALHPWQQGDAVWQWIEALTDPGETVVDPFYGSGEWGHICAAMGRRWVGCDSADGTLHN